MKNLKKLFLVLALLIFCSAMTQAQAPKTATAKFKVYGNCETCKKRIEKVTKGMNGVESGVWDVNTKIFTLKYDPSKVQPKEVEAKIAQAGHDNELHMADQKTYKSLPECCQYKRK
jgi:mercuric ion binding protein